MSVFPIRNLGSASKDNPKRLYLIKNGESLGTTIAYWGGASCSQTLIDNYRRYAFSGMFSWSRFAFIRSSEKIDFSKYKKIVWKYRNTSPNNPAISPAIAIKDYPTIRQESDCYDNNLAGWNATSSSQIFNEEGYPIEDLKVNAYLYIRPQYTYNQTSILDIVDLYLE